MIRSNHLAGHGQMVKGLTHWLKLLVTGDLELLAIDPLSF